ncbi:hypothetical protein PoB_000074300 [Plakobranchus ocellatus]|uniref:Uncharacterized protein n=1 Tax=Plakobranchus ocellatus TaxID=259542 RepID=A0AAV3XV60_9GAST|nr:hypothetical protein PoB_000074300 [Plakobranchus ocellatus]
MTFGLRNSCRSCIEGFWTSQNILWLKLVTINTYRGLYQYSRLAFRNPNQKRIARPTYWNIQNENLGQTMVAKHVRRSSEEMYVLRVRATGTFQHLRHYIIGRGRRNRGGRLQIDLAGPTASEALQRPIGYESKQLVSTVSIQEHQSGYPDM